MNEIKPACEWQIRFKSHTMHDIEIQYLKLFIVKSNGPKKNRLIRGVWVRNKNSSYIDHKFINMLQQLVTLLLVTIGLIGCSSISPKQGTHEMTSEQNGTDKDVNLKGIEDLDRIIARATGDFILGKPTGSLNNWLADAVLQSQIKHARLSAPTFCMLNYVDFKGGIKQGPLSVRDIHDLVVTNSKIVWVKLPVSTLKDIELKLKEEEGQSIAGARYTNGKFIIDGVDEKTTHFWLITTESYCQLKRNTVLINNKIQLDVTDVALTEVLIREAEEQVELNPDYTVRVD
jgi:hypothetical protein